MKRLKKYLMVGLICLTICLISIKNVNVSADQALFDEITSGLTTEEKNYLAGTKGGKMLKDATNAKTLEDWCDEYCDCLLGETLMGHIVSAYEPNEDLVEMLKFTNGNGTADFGAFDVLTQGGSNSLFKFFCILGVLLTTAYFAIELNKTVLMQGGEFTLKSFYAPFLKFTIGIILIIYLGTLVELYAGFNNAFIDRVDTALSGHSTPSGSVVTIGGVTCIIGHTDANDPLVKVGKQIYDMGLFERLGALLNCLLIGLGAAIATLVMMYQAVSRKIEIVLRTLFFPITAGDIFEGTHSPMIRYFKKMLALTLMGGGMLAIIAIGTAIQTSMTNGGFGITSLKSALMLILVPLAECGMCATVKTVCNDALGV